MSSCHRHSRIKANNIDPDDGNSWVCSACNLPIFATPFTRNGGGALLHDQCANLPEVLEECELHLQEPLLLRDNNDDDGITCSECSHKCGSKVYYCGDPSECCGLVLDVACALPVKILHRSHRHRLMAIRGDPDSSSSCGVCGEAHQAAAAASPRSYLCSVCGFWIHPDCAVLANVIQHEMHHHPLVLYYHVDAAFGADYSTPIDVNDFFGLKHSAPSQTIDTCNCAICGNGVGTRFGIYSCVNCRHYIIHIKCVTSNPPSFRAVLSGDARFPGLVRLPMADEHQSFVPYVTEATTSSSSNNKDDVEQDLTIQRIHRDFTENVKCCFVLHDENENEDDHRVCDACLKVIKAPSFYSCSVCPNFFLHDYCYRLPPLLSENPAHVPDHRFFLRPSYYIRDLGGKSSICCHCSCQYVRVSYQCNTDRCGFNLDMPCALMPGIITHEAHGTGHFLRLLKTYGLGRGCDCCGRLLDKLGYECRTCPNFALHTWCAMLPKTVSHKFDPHPLRLVTTTTTTNEEAVDMICEICENGLDNKVWHYGCQTCDQWFHAECIPCLDLLYKIKSLVSAGVYRDEVPTRLIRGLTLQGHGHDYCSRVADEYDTDDD